MKFTATENKRVYFPKKSIVFVDGKYETDNEKEIEALKKAVGVEEVKVKKDDKKS